MTVGIWVLLDQEAEADMHYDFARLLLHEAFTGRDDIVHMLLRRNAM